MAFMSESPLPRRVVDCLRVAFSENERKERRQRRKRITRNSQKTSQKVIFEETRQAFRSSVEKFLRREKNAKPVSFL